MSDKRKKVWIMLLREGLKSITRLFSSKKYTDAAIFSATAIIAIKVAVFIIEEFWFYKKGDGGGIKVRRDKEFF